MFSHVGLCGLVVLYAMLGGLTFEKIESAEERESKVKGKAPRSGKLLSAR